MRRTQYLNGVLELLLEVVRDVRAVRDVADARQRHGRRELRREAGQPRLQPPQRQQVVVGRVLAHLRVRVRVRVRVRLRLGLGLGLGLGLEVGLGLGLTWTNTP